MMKLYDFKTVNALDSITKYKTFSHYDKVLEKNFKCNSLKTLVHNLKHQRQFIKPKFLEEFNKKYPLETQELTKTDIEIKSRNFSKLLGEKKRKKINKFKIIKTIFLLLFCLKILNFLYFPFFV